MSQPEKRAVKVVYRTTSLGRNDPAEKPTGTSSSRSSNAPALHSASGARPASASASAALESVSHTQQLHELRTELQHMKLAYQKLLSDHKNVITELKSVKASQKNSDSLVNQARAEMKKAQNAKVRAEEAFDRTMKELRANREELLRSEEYTQHLLREVTLSKEAKTRAELSEGRLQIHLRELQKTMSIPISNTAASTEVGTYQAMEMSSDLRAYTQETFKKLVQEVYNLRQEKAAAELSSLEELRRVKDEKERLEESQDMVAHQIQLLLEEKIRLLKQIEQRDDLTRGLQTDIAHLSHQLDLALSDREDLEEQLTRVDLLVAEQREQFVPARDMLSSTGFPFSTMAPLMLTSPTPHTDFHSDNTASPFYTSVDDSLMLETYEYDDYENEHWAVDPAQVSDDASDTVATCAS